jgi:CheY-like chemotaxis protein
MNNNFIMVIDDSPTVRKIVEMNLQSAGYNGVSFADGTSALQWLDEHRDMRPVLVLLDVQIPDIDGYEWAMHVKSKRSFPATTIVLLSGEAVDSEKARIAGVVAHIKKPFTVEMLLTTVQTYAQANVLVEA